MTDDVRVLLEKARRRIATAERDLQFGDGEDAANRTYYAAFYAASAALASEGVSARTHHGVHDLFYKRFVETGRLPLALNTTFRRAQALRERSDDRVHAHTEASDVAELLEEVRSFVSDIERLLSA